ncbi:MAG TPA: ergothioneine biosynthesis protein EgtB [Thermoanaerobaculia bacterium]|nr:ergothioneine biosynthesis protein EgtB [Thermoanaerobaculia bacterium]
MVLDREQLLERYRETRALSLELCRPLRPEAWRIQSMPDVSPPWWNLGHTTWFFAKNVLEPFGGASPEDARFDYVLNSYYESLGPRIARTRRGLVTRPTNEEVLEFRQSVDRRMADLLGKVDGETYERLELLLFTGIQHEQQHQELLVTEIKHILGTDVPELREPYRSGASVRPAAPAPEGRFIPFEGGLHDLGNVEGGWCWDNEMPVHKAWLEPFALLNRLVTNREYLEFIEGGGYRDPLLWLSNGWARAQAEGWEAPLYWETGEAGWKVWTLSGVRTVDPDEPVCHVSFYEADAFARWKAQSGGDWADARLPTEREWEHAARVSGFAGDNFLETGPLHPAVAANEGANTGADGSLLQVAGDLWEWTSNHYEPYPGYRPFDGNLMEYNGKFMDNQRVLRGGSCATPGSHIRPSYRNFWPADARFQFTGIRLARSL